MDIVNRVKTIYTNDTSQAEAAVKRLKGVERDRAKALLNDLNEGNARLNAQIAMWTKIGAAVGAGIAIFKGLQVSARAYLEDLRLESAAAGINVDRLRASVQGLVETDDLLAFAGRTQNAIWKLNQQEMELVLRGANALRVSMGKELKPTVDALAESITKGSSRALKEFGIEVKSKTELLEVMEARVQSLGGKTTLVGDDFERAGVQWSDAVDDLKGALGRLAIQLAPAISALADFTAGMADAITKVADWDEKLRDVREDFFAWMDETFDWDTERRRQRRAPYRIDQQTRLGETLEQAIATGPGRRTPTVEEILAQIRSRATISDQQLPSWVKLGALKTPDISVPAKLKVEEIEVDARAVAEEMRTVYDAAKSTVLNLVDAIKDPRSRGWRPISEAADARETGIEGISRGAEAAAAIARANVEMAEQARGKTILETVFGTPSEIDLTTASLQTLGQVFTGVAQAAGAAFDAWITGQKSIGRAFAEGIGEVLRHTAVQAGIEAIKHTAYGVGALAFGPIMGQSAGQHFAAAAMFGGLAIAAGSAARGMGSATGQWRAPSAGGGTGSALGGRVGREAAAPDAGERTTIILMGDLYGMTDLERRDMVYRAVRQGNGQVRTSNVRRG